MDDMRTYDIKDAARSLGVAASTLRYWEREGLVRSQRNRANDYRQYSVHDLVDASEIAFYRRLGLPVKELRGLRELSVTAFDQALDRTEHDVRQRIEQLEAMRERLALQRSLNACAEDLMAAGMRAGMPAFDRLSEFDYEKPEAWLLLADEPWRYAVAIDAAHPDTVHEAVVEASMADGRAVWSRSSLPRTARGMECLLRIDPDTGASNAAQLFEQAAQHGIDPRTLVGSYLLTAAEAPHAGRWDYYRAWVVD